MERASITPLSSRQESFQAGVIWNVGSLVVLGLSGIAINFLIARWGTPEDLGVFNQAYAIYIFTSQLAVGGLQFSVLHYVSRSSERELDARISSSAIALAALLSMLIGLVVFWGREAAGSVLESPAVAKALLAVCPGLVFFSLNKVLLSVVNGLRQMRAFAVFQSLRFALIVAGVAVMLVLDMEGAYLAGSFTVAEAVLLLLLVVYFEWQALPIRLRHVRGRWLRRHAVFGARSFLSGTLSELNTRVDILVLGFFLTDETVGVYSFAAILAEGFNQLPYIVRNNLDPLLGRRFADGSVARIREYARSVRRVFWPGMAIAGALAISAYIVLLRLLFTGTAFAGSAGVFAILILGSVLSAGHRPFAGILLQGGRPTAYTLLIGAVVALNFIGNLLLIPLLGIHGAAIATAAALIVEAALVVWLAWKFFRVRLQ